MIENTDKSISLIEYISDWPDWKLNGLCLDESDLEIKRIIIEYRKKAKK